MKKELFMNLIFYQARANAYPKLLFTAKMKISIYTGSPKKHNDNFLTITNMDGFSKFLELAASKLPKFSSETLFGLYDE